MTGDDETQHNWSKFAAGTFWLRAHNWQRKSLGLGIPFSANFMRNFKFYTFKPLDFGVSRYILWTKPMMILDSARALQQGDWSIPSQYSDWFWNPHGVNWPYLPETNNLKTPWKMIGWLIWISIVMLVYNMNFQKHWMISAKNGLNLFGDPAFTDASHAAVTWRSGPQAPKGER